MLKILKLFLSNRFAVKKNYAIKVLAGCLLIGAAIGSSVVVAIGLPEINLRVINPLPISAMNDPNNELSLCRKILGPYQPEFLDIKVGIPETTIEVHRALDRSGSPGEEIFQNILKNWEKSGHYSEAALHTMTNLNNQLPLYRTSWIQMKYGLDGREWTSGMRIFDASYPHPMIMGIPWQYTVNSKRDHLSPLELMYPDGAETVLGEDPVKTKKSRRYLVHLGLLNVPNQMTGGIAAALHHVARQLDNNYNDKEMEVFGLTDVIRSLDVKIVSSCRPRLLNHYRRFGFQPRYIIKGDGKLRPFTFNDGMIYLEMRGVDLIAKYYDAQSMARLNIDDFTSKSDKSSVHPNRAANRRLKSRNLVAIDTIETYRYAVLERLPQLFSTMLDRPSQNSIRSFAKFYYTLMISLENEFKAPKWFLHWRTSSEALLLTEQGFQKDYLAAGEVPLMAKILVELKNHYIDLTKK